MKQSAQNNRDSKAHEKMKIREHIAWLKTFSSKKDTVNELVVFWEKKLIKMGANAA